MNIGIDIDGVLTDYRKFTIEQGIKYCEKTKKGKLINPNAYDSSEMFNWDKITDLDFWMKNIFLYAKNNPVIEGAAENIKKLKLDGHSIYIITARWLATPKTKNKFNQPEIVRQKMRATVKDWLKKNEIIYDEIIFSGDDKLSSIIEKSIDIMIEDSPSNLKSLSETTKMICFDWEYNRGIENSNIYRCYNWNEIYEKILELSKNKGE